MVTNEERAQKLIRKYRFDYEKISKEEIRCLLEKEIDDFQPGSSEYIRLLCGYLYCIGDSSDIPLIKRAKYEINMDVGCMIDGDWIESLQQNGRAAEYLPGRQQLMEDFEEYYRAFLSLRW